MEERETSFALSAVEGRDKRLLPFEDGYGEERVGSVGSTVG